MDSVRVDKWLWSIRLYKTRSDATHACRGGHVSVNRSSAKPATPIHLGDRVTALAGGRERVVEVAQLVEKRVGAAVAAGCFVDYSPPPPPREEAVPPLFRDPASGRPTKRDRRQIDRLRRG
ncbi:MAG: RNA-binding S4 domain-containing protein [Acidimicrobiales bacterium]